MPDAKLTAIKATSPAGRPCQNQAESAAAGGKNTAPTPPEGALVGTDNADFLESTASGDMLCGLGGPTENFG